MKTEAYVGRTGFGMLLGLLCVLSAQAEETTRDAFVMTVYSDSAHGTAILDGQSAEVVSKLADQSGDGSRDLAEQVNLCVAFTKTKQLEKATAACDDAVAMSVREARRLDRTGRFGRRTTRVADTGRAIALTNRGVLYAIAGDEDKARVMFEMAMLLKSKEKSASTNLAQLERRLASRDS